MKMLQTVTSSQPIFISVDALDESAEEYWSYVLDSLGHILDKLPNTSIFLTGGRHIRCEIERHPGGEWQFHFSNSNIKSSGNNSEQITFNFIRYWGHYSALKTRQIHRPVDCSPLFPEFYCGAWQARSTTLFRLRGQPQAENTVPGALSSCLFLPLKYPFQTTKFSIINDMQYSQIQNQLRFIVVSHNL